MKYILAIFAAMFVSTASASISESEIDIIQEYELWDVLFIHDQNKCAIGTLQDVNNLHFITHDNENGYQLTIVTPHVREGKTEFQLSTEQYMMMINDVYEITYGDVVVSLNTDIMHSIMISDFITYTSMYTGEVTLLTQGITDAFVFFIENCQL